MNDRTLRGRPSRPCDGFPQSNWRAWRDHVLDVPKEVLCAAALAERLERSLAWEHDHTGRSSRDIATAADVAQSTISDLRRCRTYASAGVIISLEFVLDTQLWPGPEIAEHTRKARDLRAVRVTADRRQPAGQPAA